MPFLTQLEVVEASETANAERGEWELAQPLIYRALNGSVYTVPAGFKTDFASVPRLPLLFALLGDVAHEAAALHDYLYTAPHPCSRDRADSLLREAAIGSGVHGWQAAMLYYGVRLFGGSHWE